MYNELQTTFLLPKYLSTLMNNKWRQDALRNTSVRRIVVWHNCWPYARLGPYFWVMEIRGKMTTPTGKSAKARLTIRALVAERSFLFMMTARITKPFPEGIKLGELLETSWMTGMAGKVLFKNWTFHRQESGLCGRGKEKKMSLILTSGNEIKLEWKVHLVTYTWRTVVTYSRCYCRCD